MAPLLLVAVGAIVATRAGLINIGQEGQLLIGACFGAYVAVRLPGPGPLVLVATLAAAAVGGGLWAGIAAALKVWRNVPEVLQHAAAHVRRLPAADVRPPSGVAARRPREPDATHQLRRTDPLRHPAARTSTCSATTSTRRCSSPSAPPPSSPHVLAHTRLGARIDVLGLNPRAAQRFGVPQRPLTAAVLVASGCFAGLAGAVLLTGGASGDRLSVGYSGNYGWDGLLVALVARNRVLMAIPTAFVFAALRTGSSFLAATGVDRR